MSEPITPARLKKLGFAKHKDAAYYNGRPFWTLAIPSRDGLAVDCVEDKSGNWSIVVNDVEGSEIRLPFMFPHMGNVERILVALGVVIGEGKNVVKV